MATLALNHYTFRAAQPLLGQIRDFYVEVVGLREGWRPPFDFPGFWLYAGDTAVLHLIGSTGNSPADSRPSGSYDHAAFSCTGLAEVEQRLQSRGIPYRRSAVPGTRQVQLFVTDPGGYGVEFNFDGDAVAP
jgi:catechol 2,3-dioxygenase-like lactoylglutathione lyase family enzyme